MKKTIMVIALILWGLFFYTQLRADELTCETLAKELKEIEIKIEKNNKLLEDIEYKLYHIEDYTKRLEDMLIRIEGNHR
jgi:uncharacterized protein YoxC